MVSLMLRETHQKVGPSLDVGGYETAVGLPNLRIRGHIVYEDYGYARAHLLRSLCLSHIPSFDTTIAAAS